MSWDEEYDEETFQYIKDKEVVQIFEAWLERQNDSGREVPSSGHDDPNEFNFQAFFEHGAWSVTETTTGAVWSAHLATGGDSVEGLTFENVAEGEFYDSWEGWPD